MKKKVMVIEFMTSSLEAVAWLSIVLNDGTVDDADGVALALMGSPIVVRQTGTGREYRPGSPSLFPVEEGWAPLIRMRG